MFGDVHHVSSTWSASCFFRRTLGRPDSEDTKATEFCKTIYSQNRVTQQWHLSYLFINIITTSVTVFVLPGYQVLYSDVTQLHRLRTQARSDFVLHPFDFVKTSGRPDICLNARTNVNRRERLFGYERDGLKLPSWNPRFASLISGWITLVPWAARTQQTVAKWCLWEADKETVDISLISDFNIGFTAVWN
jgi:hypothetical protein